MTDNKKRSDCVGNVVVTALLALAGCTLLNVPIGLVGAAYCQWKMSREARLHEKAEWKDVRDCWLFSCIPLVGPPFAFFAYSMRGLGT